MKALIVEDDKLLAHRIAKVISEKFESEIVFNATESLDKIRENTYDLIIVDSIMKDVNAIKLLKELEALKIEVPTIALTFSVSSEDKEEILNYPMADYFLRSQSESDFLITVDNLLKRFKNKKNKDILTYKKISVNIKTETVTFEDKVLENIKGKYLELLHFFILNNNIILRKEEIFDRVWGVNSETTMNAIEVYISGLRKELKKVGCEKYLKTIRGVGYSLS